MQKRKLLEKKSFHSAIISSIRATMLEKGTETEKHAERLSGLAEKIGHQVHLSRTELDELVLLSVLHDIGKVGIDDQILNKPEKLSDEEWAVMRKHPEIDYRIAMSPPS
jgi:HD-GYP domain-containing protein (c-di-GMP phosphodiesterase class II)